MNAVRLFLSLAIVLIIGIAGSYFTSQSVKTWYPTLQKPFFTPPDWLFAPAWTTLYILIGLALYVCWQNSFWKNSRLRFFLLLTACTKLFVVSALLWSSESIAWLN